MLGAAAAEGRGVTLEAVAERFGDGVWFVALAPISVPLPPKQAPSASDHHKGRISG